MDNKQYFGRFGSIDTKQCCDSFGLQVIIWEHGFANDTLIMVVCKHLIARLHKQYFGHAGLQTVV